MNRISESQFINQTPDVDQLQSFFNDRSAPQIQRLHCLMNLIVMENTDSLEGRHFTHS